MKTLIEALQSPDGSISFMRFAVLLILVAVLFNWCFLTVVNKAPQTLDWQQVTLILGSLGVKVLQRPFESKPPSIPLQ